MTQIKVIDVSHHQPAPIDWAKVKAFGISAVIIKATEGMNEIKADVKEITGRPTKLWDYLVSAIIGTLAAGIVGAILSGIIK